MELEIGTIRHLQEYAAFKSKERGFDDETAEERLIILVEELGEIMKAYRKRAGMYVNQADKKNDDIGQEIGDVLNMLMAFANAVGVDVENDFRAKEEKNDLRNYKRGAKKT